MLIFQPFHKSHWMHDRKTFWLSQNATLLDNASLFPCYLRLRFTPSCLMAPTTEISVIDWLIDWLHGINGHIHEESVCCNIKNDSCDLITCRGHDRGALPCFRFSTVGMQPLHTLRLPILYKSSRSKTLLNLFFIEKHKHLFCHQFCSQLLHASESTRHLPSVWEMNSRSQRLLLLYSG